MYRIWIDDERPTPKNEFDASAQTADCALKIILHKISVMLEAIRFVQLNLHI